MTDVIDQVLTSRLPVEGADLDPADVSSDQIERWHLACRQHQEAARRHLGQAVVYAAMIGRALKAQRAGIGHGQIGAWMATLPFSKSMAYNYIRVHEHVSELGDRLSNTLEKLHPGLPLRQFIARLPRRRVSRQVVHRGPVEIRRPHYHLLYGIDAREALRQIADRSIHVCITSPPYYHARDYSTPPQVWGGDPECKHRWDCDSYCACCGAWLGHLGREPHPDAFVDHLVEVFREVHRVLRDDGTLWLVMGDGYMSHGATDTTRSGGFTGRKMRRNPALCDAVVVGKPVTAGLKDKDLIGIPFRAALALQADGWWWRSTIVWEKPNALPSSAEDRPHLCHEYVLMFSKQAHYFYDPHPVREGDHHCRTVWSVPTVPFPEAHFATFPPEPARRMVSAATSERGVCQKCGVPWNRIIQRGGTTASDAEADAPGTNRCTTTVGWAPNCDCGDESPIPSTVLDPFCGSGTTGMVAVGLGRDFIGIDLNSAFLEMAERRISGQ